MRAKIGIASAEQREAIALFGRAALNAFKEVETALTNEVLLAGGLEALRGPTRLASRRRASPRTSSRQGPSTSCPCFSFQTAQLAVEANVIKVRNARIQNRIQLYLALGGGWDNVRPLRRS